MKLFKYYTASIVLLTIFVLSSCNDTYEFHQKYIEDGEVQYSNKVDSLKAYSGNNRLKIAGYISNAFNVNEIIVYWNNGANNKIFPYTKSQNQTDALEFIIDGLEEKSYTFEVISKEPSGNVSIKTVAFGTVYGENFRSSLTPRALNTFTYKSDVKEADVTFKLSDDLTRNTELKYTNLSNAEVVDIIANDVASISIEQLDITKPIHYRTFYVPTLADIDGMETSIDQFNSDWNIINPPLNLETILNSITLQPSVGGVTVNWENSENLNLNFNFKNTVANNPVNNSITSNNTVGTHTIEPMENGTQDIEITVTDTYGNSWTKIYSVTPLDLVQFNKSGWSVINFSSVAVGYPASNIIDGDLSTFWHTPWGAGAPNYPHSVTVDMSIQKNIVKFEMFRRQGFAGEATLHEFWISSDNITWTKAATYTGVLPTNDGVLLNAPANTSARYVRYVAVTGPKVFTHLGEINVYGLAN